MLRTLGFLVVALMVTAARAADPPEMRSIYVPNFTVRTQATCDAVIANILARAGKINAVFVEVRGRADAYYYPNRSDSTYPNNEPRGEQYTISPADLDILQYFIDRLHASTPRIEVHAWCTTFNSWDSGTPPSSPNHVYNAHPDWITENAAGVTYTSASDAPLDPGIPAVQTHLYNVFMDIVRNYDVDGINFDYIRLLNADSGYDPVAKQQFLLQTGHNYNTENSGGRLAKSYSAWRRDQISKVVQRIHKQSNLEKPWVEVSAFLINFNDPVDVMGQGFNWWVAHNAIDVLHPGCYSSTVTGTVNDWNFYVGKLAQNGDQNKRPIVAAVGDYLLTGANDSAQAVTTLRTNSRKPDGFNMYAYASVFVDNGGQHATALFNAGGPFAVDAPLPAIAHKAEDFVAPNAPAGAAVNLIAGLPRITFNRPAAASDGDLPVHYRVYRDTQTPVRLYYSNMVMEWWDQGSPRASFSIDDTFAPSGNVYYAAVAYDDWNNEARSNVGPVNLATASGEFIVETRTGGKNVANYSEAGGSFADSSSHSTASGCTTGLGSRYAISSNGADKCRFSTNGFPGGTYDVYVTCVSAASSNAQDITVRVSDNAGVRVVSSAFDLTQSTAGNKWYAVTAITVSGTTGQYVEFDSSTQSNPGDGTNSRLNAAAVRFVSRSAPAREQKPAVVQPGSSVTEVIVDNAPQALDYDDGTGWATTTFGPGGLYGGSARFEASTSSSAPPASVAVWVVDLPRAGKWAIDGWIRHDTGWAANAQYRFVDGTGTVRNVETSQQSTFVSTTSGDWIINVDGVNDSNAYTFNAGRVYVTLYGNNNATAQSLVADALRFRYVGTTSNVEDWKLY